MNDAVEQICVPDQKSFGADQHADDDKVGQNGLWPVDFLERSGELRFQDVFLCMQHIKWLWKKSLCF